MKKVIVALNYNSMSAIEKTVFADKVISAMTGNTALPSPYPTVATLSATNANLKAAIAAASLGGINTTATEHEKEAVLERTLKAIAGYVEYEANNNEAIVLSSGYNVKQTAGKVIKGFNVTQGALSGTALLETKNIGNCSFVWALCLDPLSANAWEQQKITLQSKTTITGLTPGVKYWFRVALITKDGQQSWSDPYMLLVV